MKSPVFVGVGGTGQTVLAAYLRLASMAGFTPAPFFVVDSDTRGPLGSLLNELKGGVREVMGGKEPPSKWMIDPFPSQYAERQSFGGLFGHLAGDRRELFDCLFSEEAEATPIRTGMYGRPSVGATCIRYKIQQDDDDLRELKQALMGGDKHVMLVGSCFGGTGSGGVPMLAAEFHRLKKDEPGYRLKVDAVVFLPWFRLVPPSGGLSKEDKGLYEHLNRNFEPNAAAGIYYFRDQMRDRVESLLLLGVPDRGQVTRVSSESAQEEAPHVLNLLAAILVQNHFCEALQPPHGISAYWYDPEAGLRPDSLLVHRAAGAEPLTLLQVIHRAYLRQHWLRILATFFENFLRLPRSHQPIFLRIATSRLRGETRSDRQVVANIAAHLGKLEKQAKENLAWVRRMADSGFFPLAAGAEKVQGERYDRMAEQPLKEIEAFCDEPELVARFGKADFRSADGFTEKFANLYVNHLTKVLSL